MIFFIVLIILLVLILILQMIIVPIPLNGSLNATFANDSDFLPTFISASILTNWLDDLPTKPAPQAWRGIPQAQESSSDTVGEGLNGHHNYSDDVTKFLNTTSDTSVGNGVQGDDGTINLLNSSKDDVVKSLFESPRDPSKAADGDWSVVLGKFDHYDDENWNEFLLKTEVPFMVRMFLAESSETVEITRKLKPRKKDTQTGKKKRCLSKKTNKGCLYSPSDYEIKLATSSWLLTVVSTFRLGESFIEHDIDGTDSKNTFFFSTPRLLVHNKLKNKWRTAIVRHFDESGLNMTFVDKDRLVMARRFFKRIK